MVSEDLDLEIEIYKEPCLSMLNDEDVEADLDLEKRSEDDTPLPLPAHKRNEPHEEATRFYTPKILDYIEEIMGKDKAREIGERAFKRGISQRFGGEYYPDIYNELSGRDN